MPAGTRAAIATSYRPCAVATPAPAATSRPASHTGVRPASAPCRVMTGPVAGSAGAGRRSRRAGLVWAPAAAEGPPAGDRSDRVGQRHGGRPVLVPAREVGFQRAGAGVLPNAAHHAGAVPV